MVKAAVDQSEAELRSNQSDSSMTSWVMTSAPETKHPSRSSLCSFLSNKFKDTERKHSVLAVLASVRPALWPETYYLGALHHIIISVKMWPNSYNYALVFDTFWVFRWTGFAFQDWSSLTLHIVVYLQCCTVYWIALYSGHIFWILLHSAKIILSI